MTLSNTIDERCPNCGLLGDDCDCPDKEGKAKFAPMSVPYGGENGGRYWFNDEGWWYDTGKPNTPDVGPANSFDELCGMVLAA